MLDLVAVFGPRGFVEVHRFPNEMESEAYYRGFAHALGMVPHDGIHAYVLPRDDEAMRDFESADAITALWRAVHP